MIKAKRLPVQLLDNGLGGKLTLADLAKIEKDLHGRKPRHRGDGSALRQWQHQPAGVRQPERQNASQRRPLDLPPTCSNWRSRCQASTAAGSRTASANRSASSKRNARTRKTTRPRLDDYDVVSTGPSRTLGGKDNLNIAAAVTRNRHWEGIIGGGKRTKVPKRPRPGARRSNIASWNATWRAWRCRPCRWPARAATPETSPPTRPGNGIGGGAASVTRVREFFPETMLWQPALITDDKGVADLTSASPTPSRPGARASANSKGAPSAAPPSPSRSSRTSSSISICPSI